MNATRPNSRYGSRSSSRLVTAGQVGPAGAYYLVFFLLPLGWLAAVSFFTQDGARYTTELTMANYVAVLTDPIHLRLALRTLQFGFLVTAAVVVLSYPLCFLLNFVLRKHRSAFYFLILVSLFGGRLVRIYAWRSILGKEGVINQLLVGIGVVDQPIDQLLHSMFAVGLSAASFLIPLAVLPMYSAMQGISPSVVEAAQDLGATRFRAAFDIILPLSLRGIRASAAIVMIWVLGEWLTPRLLGGPADLLLGNRIEYYFGPGFNWPEGAALAMVMLLGMVLFAGVVMLSVRGLSIRRRSRWVS